MPSSSLCHVVGFVVEWLVTVGGLDCQASSLACPQLFGHYYEGHSVFKLQNGIVLLTFKI